MQTITPILAATVEADAAVPTGNPQTATAYSRLSRGEDDEPQCASTLLLSARGYRRNGFQRVDLFWSGLSAHGFDVYRDGERIATVLTGPYHDKLDLSGSGSYRYHVTETATAACSNDAAVTFRDPGGRSSVPRLRRDRDRAIAEAAHAPPQLAHSPGLRASA